MYVHDRDSKFKVDVEKVKKEKEDNVVDLDAIIKESGLLDRDDDIRDYVRHKDLTGMTV